MLNATAVQLSDLGRDSMPDPRPLIADLPRAENPIQARLIEGRQFVIAVPEGPYAEAYIFTLQQFSYQDQTPRWEITCDNVPTVYGTHNKERLLCLGDQVAWIQVQRHPLTIYPSPRGARIAFHLMLPKDWRYVQYGEYTRLCDPQ
jgi:hypothetical protein